MSALEIKMPKAHKVTNINKFYITDFMINIAEEDMTPDQFFTSVDIYEKKIDKYLIISRFKNQELEKIVSYVDETRVFEYGCWNTKYLDYTEEHLDQILKILKKQKITFDLDSIPDMQIIE